MEEQEAIINTDTPYYNKGRLYYHIASYSLAGIILLSMVFGWVLNSETFDAPRNVLIIGLTIAAFITVPIGLYNIIKSIRHKEAAGKYRTYYLIALIFFQTCMAILTGTFLMLSGIVC